ncbi:hypothetical protein [Mycoplasma suis]|uniref:Uncharacterized protein n=2 Tax=Mycoplasma suis TaxID=57372 RepID=F0QQH2_MYCSL|nr:hypothetical protein [Mycoplasma suis]ADX97742.1 hypothetical protein MSU_0198 [Mycoplasma suis str. Illinois]CBZ40292.1 hypothetical protein MSUIS_01990 [Mycoplasma suis KI3806]
MILKGLGGYGWTLIAGFGSALGLGGYGVLNYLGKEQEDDSSPFLWSMTASQENQKIKFAQYITKKHISDTKENCQKWVNGKIENMSQSECKKLIQTNWSGNISLQPDIWIQADKESLEEALWEYFSSNSRTVERQELSKSSWTVNELICNRKDSEKYSEVNCSHKVEPEEDSN